MNIIALDSYTGKLTYRNILKKLTPNQPLQPISYILLFFSRPFLVESRVSEERSEVDLRIPPNRLVLKQGFDLLTRFRRDVVIIIHVTMTMNINSTITAVLYIRTASYFPVIGSRS